jgi:broad specificity phosphatase PhoE
MLADRTIVAGVRWIFVGIVAALFTLNPLAASAAADPLNLPRVIYLMRHAEKPTEPHDPHLSAAGVARAGKLPGYFPGLLGNGRSLDFIFATGPSKNSNRPYETVVPLAGSLHLSVDQSFANSSYGALAEAIRSRGSYAGKTILISWHHGTLPALARALGAVSAPAKWPSSSFNMIWKLTYDSQGNARLEQIREPF